MYREVIEAANQIQVNRLHEISFFDGRQRKLRYRDGPATRRDGLYWIYTSYTEDELSRAVRCQKVGSVDFSAMVDRHRSLSNVCTLEVDGFRLVYNGIGGGGGGLRERILSEFRGGQGTGALAIRDSSLGDLSRWRVSHVLWSEISFAAHHEYGSFAEVLERLWRIHYGWPLLCTK
jgi:hypothetical protein